MSKSEVAMIVVGLLNVIVQVPAMMVAIKAFKFESTKK